MKQIISINVGQCGCQIGSSIWELLANEHNLSYNGYKINTVDDLYEFTDGYFKINKKGRYTPRVLFVDLEPLVIDQIKSSKLRSLFHRSQLINGFDDACNNFARGYFTAGRDIYEACENQLRHEMELADILGCFYFHRSLGGGTGSGLTSLLYQLLSELASKVPMIEIPIHPSPILESAIVDPYNCILSEHFCIDDTDISMLMDNESLYDILNDNMNCPSPRFSHLNCLIAQVISGLTCSSRFSAFMQCDLINMTNLVPYPRIHFPIIGFAPWGSSQRQTQTCYSILDITRDVFSSHNQLINCDPSRGRYMSCMLLYRGDINPSKVHESLLFVKGCGHVKFVDWCPTGFKVGIVQHTLGPQNISLSDIDDSWLPKRSVVMVTNNSSVSSLWHRLSQKFHKLYSKHSFVHWFIGEGLEEDEFSDSLYNIATLAQDYEEVSLDTNFKEQITHTVQSMLQETTSDNLIQSKDTSKKKKMKKKKKKTGSKAVDETILPSKKISDTEKQVGTEADNIRDGEVIIDDLVIHREQNKKYLDVEEDVEREPESKEVGGEVEIKEEKQDRAEEILEEVEEGVEEKENKVEGELEERQDESEGELEEKKKAEEELEEKEGADEDLKEKEDGEEESKEQQEDLDEFVDKQEGDQEKLEKLEEVEDEIDTECERYEISKDKEEEVEEEEGEANTKKEISEEYDRLNKEDIKLMESVNEIVEHISESFQQEEEAEPMNDIVDTDKFEDQSGAKETVVTDEAEEKLESVKEVVVEEEVREEDAANIGTERSSQDEENTKEERTTGDEEEIRKANEELCPMSNEDDNEKRTNEEGNKIDEEKEKGEESGETEEERGEETGETEEEREETKETEEEREETRETEEERGEETGETEEERGEETGETEEERGEETRETEEEIEERKEENVEQQEEYEMEEETERLEKENSENINEVEEVQVEKDISFENQEKEEDNDEEGKDNNKGVNKGKDSEDIEEDDKEEIEETEEVVEIEETEEEAKEEPGEEEVEVEETEEVVEVEETEEEAKETGEEAKEEPGEEEIEVEETEDEAKKEADEEEVEVEETIEEAKEETEVEEIGEDKEGFEDEESETKETGEEEEEEGEEEEMDNDENNKNKNQPNNNDDDDDSIQENMSNFLEQCYQTSVRRSNNTDAFTTTYSLDYVRVNRESPQSWNFLSESNSLQLLENVTSTFHDEYVQNDDEDEEARTQSLMRELIRMTSAFNITENDSSSSFN